MGIFDYLQNHQDNTATFRDQSGTPIVTMPWGHPDAQARMAGLPQGTPAPSQYAPFQGQQSTYQQPLPPAAPMSLGAAAGNALGGAQYQNAMAPTQASQYQTLANQQGMSQSAMAQRVPAPQQSVNQPGFQGAMGMVAAAQQAGRVPMPAQQQSAVAPQPGAQYQTVANQQATQSNAQAVNPAMYQTRVQQNAMVPQQNQGGTLMQRVAPIASAPPTLGQRPISPLPQNMGSINAALHTGGMPGVPMNQPAPARPAAGLGSTVGAALGGLR